MYELGYLIGRIAFVVGMFEILKFLHEWWKKYSEKRRDKAKVEQIAREEQAKAATAKAEVESQILRDISDKLDKVIGDQKHDDWKEGYVEDENGKRKIYFREING